MSVLPHDLVYKYSYKNRLHLSLLKQKILIASDDFYLEFLEKKKKVVPTLSCFDFYNIWN